MSSPELTPPLTRRAFLTAGGAAVVYLAGGRSAFGADRVARTARGYLPCPWIAVTEQNDVVVLVDKCEMGQGVRHMFASIVAEELHLRLNTVKVEDAPADASLYGNSHIVPTIRGFSLGRFFPFQMTGRSSSVADMCERAKLRAAAAGTRRLLVRRAAKQFNRKPGEIDLDAGYAIARRDPPRIARFADLLAGRPAEASAGTLSRTRSALGDADVSRWRIDAPDKVTGRARFGIDLDADDLRRDGRCVKEVLVALARRPSRTGDTIDLLNPAEIRSMPGVKHVVELAGGRGVAVVADSFWHADRARRAMRSSEPSPRGERAGSAASLKSTSRPSRRPPATSPRSPRRPAPRQPR